MNFCHSCGKSLWHDSSNLDNLCFCGTVEVDVLDGLGDTLNEVLDIHDGDHVGYPGKSSTETFDCLESECIYVADQMGLGKNEAFPHTVLYSSSASSNEEDEVGSKLQANNSTEYLSVNHFVSTSFHHVSAMKGSRGREGKEQKKLTVTWGPDVYDPTPTAVSHVGKGGRSPSRSRNPKKNGKSKHRGKGKAQPRKGSGKNGCGSSYLRKTVGKVQMSVAEAL